MTVYSGQGADSSAVIKQLTQPTLLCNHKSGKRCMHAGSSGYSQSWVSSCGLEIRRRLRTKRVRKQKTDREDARLMLKLLRENRFPKIWVPSPENRDLRQLLWHRHRLVQMRTRIMNQLQAVAMNEGYRWKKKLFSEKGRALLEKLSLAPWASRRGKELLELLDQLDPKIEELTAAVATMMDRLGAPLKVRQERLGHSDPRITQTIYTHVASEDSRRVAAQLGEAVWGILDANGRKKENGSGLEHPKPLFLN